MWAGWGKKLPVGRSGFFFFFFLISIFFLKDEKKSSSRPFLAHPAGGQETIFYLRMASGYQPLLVAVDVSIGGLPDLDPIRAKYTPGRDGMETGVGSQVV